MLDLWLNNSGYLRDILIIFYSSDTFNELSNEEGYLPF